MNAVNIALHPTQGRLDDFGCSSLRAHAMRDQQALRIPSEHFLACRARGAVAQEARAPIARSAAPLAEQAADFQESSFPAGNVCLGKTLDEIADDRGARSAMEKHDFGHCERAAENDLIDVRFPR